MRFSREAIKRCDLPENAMVFEQMSDYLSMIALLTKATADTLGDSTGMTVLQYRIASIAAQGGPVGVSGLSKRLGTRASTISAATSTLCDDGILERTESADDMRMVQLHLTKRGKVELARADRAVRAVAEDYASYLSDAQLDAVSSGSALVVASHPGQSFSAGRADPAVVLADAVFVTREMLGRKMRELGLVPRDYRVLLAAKTLQGRCTSSDVAEYLFLSPADITSCLKNLDVRGYITRMRVEGNRRMRNIGITEAGARALEDLTPRVFDALYEAGPNDDATIGVFLDAAHELMNRKRNRGNFR